MDPQISSTTQSSISDGSGAEECETVPESPKLSSPAFRGGRQSSRCDKVRRWLDNYCRPGGRYDLRRRKSPSSTSARHQDTDNGHGYAACNGESPFSSSPPSDNMDVTTSEEEDDVDTAHYSLEVQTGLALHWKKQLLIRSISDERANSQEQASHSR